MRRNDDIDKVERSLERIELVIPAGIIVDDFDKVVANQTLLLVKFGVVCMVGHHCSRVEDSLDKVVPPCISILSVRVIFAVETTSENVDLTLQLDKRSQSRKEFAVERRPLNVCKDIVFVCLTRSHIEDTQFGSIDDWRQLNVAERTVEPLFVRDWTTMYGVEAIRGV